VGWLATFPLDVVKTRVQGTGFGALPGTVTPLLAGASTPAANPYRTTWSTIVNSYRAEGLSVFYRGLAPTLIRCEGLFLQIYIRYVVYRAVPVNMVTFGIFEVVVSSFG
jgi:solute carrier family 25 carnitine/acylcarnitine transporter 20/29